MTPETPDEQDALWELLGRGRPTRVSPFFARNVLRQIREQEAEPSGLLARLVRRLPILAGASCALAVIGFTWWPRLTADSGRPSVAAVTPATTAPAVVTVPAKQGTAADPLIELAEVLGTSPDLAVIGNLDELLAAEESSVWLTQPVF